MSSLRRIVSLLFFPATVFLWFLGWALYWIGDESSSRRTPSSIDDGISIVTAIYEENIMTRRSKN